MLPRRVGLSRNSGNFRTPFLKGKRSEKSDSLAITRDSSTYSLLAERVSIMSADMAEEDIFASPKDSDDEETEIESPKLPSIAANTTLRTLKHPASSGRQSRSSKRRTPPLTEDALDDSQYDAIKEQSNISTSSQARNGSSQTSSSRAKKTRQKNSEGGSDVAELQLGKDMDWQNRPSQKIKRARTYGGSSQLKKQDLSPLPKFKSHAVPGINVSIQSWSATKLKFHSIEPSHTT